MEEEEEPEREKNMGVSYGESEHSNKETMEDNSHESDMKLEDQKEDESRSISPIKKVYTSRQRDKISLFILFFIFFVLVRSNHRSTKGVKLLRIREM